MLGKKVQRLLQSLNHDVLRVFELNLHDVSNGKLYQKSCDLNRILVTCDSDFDELDIGINDNMSIIYLVPKPTNAISILLPFIEKNFPDIETTFQKNHLIIIKNENIEYIKFNE